MDLTQERDEWLMAQAAQGRRDYLEPLVRRHAGRLLTFINRMVGDPHRSEELFQEVFLAVWKKRSQYKYPMLFRAWLYKIALNKCRESFRSPASRPPETLREEMVPASDDASSEPQTVAIAAETAAQVSQCVTRLPVKQRTVVVLRIWDELSYAEIADAMGTTESTVRSQMHHGLAALRSALRLPSRD